MRTSISIILRHFSNVPTSIFGQRDYLIVHQALDLVAKKCWPQLALKQHLNMRYYQTLVAFEPILPLQLNGDTRPQPHLPRPTWHSNNQALPGGGAPSIQTRFSLDSNLLRCSHQLNHRSSSLVPPKKEDLVTFGRFLGLHKKFIACCGELTGDRFTNKKSTVTLRWSGYKFLLLHYRLCFLQCDYPRENSPQKS